MLHHIPYLTLVSYLDPSSIREGSGYEANLVVHCAVYVNHYQFNELAGQCRIEHLDKWCRDLKILYLQSNLIPKIGEKP